MRTAVLLVVVILCGCVPRTSKEVAEPDCSPMSHMARLEPIVSRDFGGDVTPQDVMAAIVKTLTMGGMRIESTDYVAGALVTEIFRGDTVAFACDLETTYSYQMRFAVTEGIAIVSTHCWSQSRRPSTGQQTGISPCGRDAVVSREDSKWPLRILGGAESDLKLRQTRRQRGLAAPIELTSDGVYE